MHPLIPMLICWTSLTPGVPGPVFVLPIQPEEYIENQLYEDSRFDQNILDLCQAQRPETVVKADATIALRLDSLRPDEIE